MTRAVDPVSFKAMRNTDAASRTVSTAWLVLMEPDASSTRVTRSTPPGGAWNSTLNGLRSCAGVRLRPEMVAARTCAAPCTAK